MALETSVETICGAAMATLWRPSITPAWSSGFSELEPRRRTSLSRFEISALMRAKGAHKVRAQGKPTTPANTVAWVGVEMKKVEAMQTAKRIWESSQARRRVSHFIWQRSKRRVRRAWRVGDGEGAEGKKDVILAERVPGVPGVWCGGVEGVLGGGAL